MSVPTCSNPCDPIRLLSRLSRYPPSVTSDERAIAGRIGGYRWSGQIFQAGGRGKKKGRRLSTAGPWLLLPLGWRLAWTTRGAGGLTKSGLSCQSPKQLLHVCPPIRAALGPDSGETVKSSPAHPAPYPGRGPAMQALRTRAIRVIIGSDETGFGAEPGPPDRSDRTEWISWSR